MLIWRVAAVLTSTAPISGANEAFVDHVKQVGILQCCCNTLFVIQLFVDRCFSGVGTWRDVDVNL